MFFWNRSINKLAKEDSIESKQSHSLPKNSNQNPKEFKTSQNQNFLGAVRDGGIWLS